MNNEFKSFPDLLSFGDVEVVDYDNSQMPSLFVWIAHPKELRCPICGSTNITKKSRYSRTLQDCSTLGIPTVLRIDTNRIDCHNETVAHKSRKGLVPKIEGLPKGAKITPRLKSEIANYDFAHYTFKQISDLCHVSPELVAKVFEEKAKLFDAENTLYPECTVIGIDEAHLGYLGSSNRPRMCATIVDLSHEETVLLDILPRNNKATVIEALNRFTNPEKIKWVTTDMCKTYSEAVAECLPNAKIIIDRFHIESHLSAAVGEATKRTTELIKARLNGMPDKEQREKALREFSERSKSHFWFRKKMSTYSDADLTLEAMKHGEKVPKKKAEYAKNLRLQFERFMALCQDYPEYAEVVSVHEAFVAMYDMTTRKDAWIAFRHAVHLLNEAKGKNPALGAFDAYISTFMHWYDKILNYFDATDAPHRSNGPVEQWNREVKSAHNAGRGYTYENLRFKILYGSKQIQLNKAFKFQPQISYTGTAKVLYQGNCHELSEEQIHCTRTIVKYLAATPEMQDNEFVEEVVANINTVEFCLLREVFVTNPPLSFDIAKKLDAGMLLPEYNAFSGVTFEDIHAATTLIHAQLVASLEDDKFLVDVDCDEEDD